MLGTIGIRNETKDPRERRAPLTPEHVRRLVADHGIDVAVESSRSRVFTDGDYTAAGARVVHALTDCNVVLGVKEIPERDLVDAPAFLFFSHTTKEQPENMPMLRKLLERGATLIDYELVRNERGRRLIAFGTYAGYAGMVNTLWALGRRLRWEGIDNPFERIRRPHRYRDLADIRAALREVGKIVRAVGLPRAVVPFLCGITGQGRVARGAMELLKELPTERIKADDLPRFFASGRFDPHVVYRVEFYQGDLYEPSRPGETFDRKRLHRHPERFAGRLERVLPYLHVLVNGIFWEPRYPRLVTKSHLRRAYEIDPNPRLRVIGDITCDVDGSIEPTVRATTIDDPVYVYEPLADRTVDGLEGLGPVIMAVDKLPTELPRQASETFGDALMPFVPALARTEFSEPLEASTLPAALREAVVAHRGELRPDYVYLRESVESAPA